MATEKRLTVRTEIVNKSSYWLEGDLKQTIDKLTEVYDEQIGCYDSMNLVTYTCEEYGDIKCEVIITGVRDETDVEQSQRLKTEAQRLEIINKRELATIKLAIEKIGSEAVLKLIGEVNE